MNSTPSMKVKELFLAARELEGQGRADFLGQACGLDAALRRRIEALIRAETALGPDLLSPAPSIVSTPDEIDRYELLDVLGEGGFGTVYRARRRRGVQGEVAIKVLRAGTEAAPALARFRDEQRSLEAMDHPGIARVLDAGATVSGRPFIVMELVRGETITTFCERSRLTVNQRVTLMAEVCRAVQHAHNKGVIHRDLKPSNILAWESEGRLWAKVIDFGIAKIVETSLGEGGAATTRVMELVGTPAYMSPEQARGPGAGDIDTRADVYALGAVLYELLCGQPVIDPATLAPASPGAVERMICETIPPPPSERALPGDRKLSRRLHGELDWITMRAIEKDRARRYPTAQALGDDLERVARGEAVQAAPPSRLYRLSRLVQRERGLFIGLGAALVALAVGAGIATTMGVRAVRAERQSEQASRVAQAVNNFVRSDLLAAVAPKGGVAGRGRDVKMREVLDEASRRIQSASQPGGTLAGEPLVQAGVRETLCSTYLSLGEFQLALEHAIVANDLYAQELGPKSREALQTRLRIAHAKWDLWQFHEALDDYTEVYNVALELWGERDQLTLDALAGVAGVNSWGLFNRAESVRLWAKVYDLRKETLGPDDASTLDAGHGLGIALFFAERWAEAEDVFRDVLERRIRATGPLSPGTISSEFFMARSGVCLRPQEFEANEAAFRSVLAKSTQVLGTQHIATLAIMQDLGDLYLRQGLFWKAVAVLEPTYNLKRVALGENHIDTVTAESSLGFSLGLLGFRQEGLELLRDSINRQESLPRQEAPGLPDAYDHFRELNNAVPSSQHDWRGF